jgi:hypothetical protein
MLCNFSILGPRRAREMLEGKIIGNRFAPVKGEHIKHDDIS